MLRSTDSTVEWALVAIDVCILPDLKCWLDDLKEYTNNNEYTNNELTQVLSSLNANNKKHRP